MCASFGLQLSPDEFATDFGVEDARGSTSELAEWLVAQGDAPVRPTGTRARNLAPIIRGVAGAGPDAAPADAGRDAPAAPPAREAVLAWWKLWVGGAPAPFPAINARAEKLLTGAWKAPAASRRVLVPATCFFEPGHRFALPDGGAFTMAGIANVSRLSQPDPVLGDRVVSFAVVTRPVLPEFASIHDRLPLLVPREFRDDWLDPASGADEGLVDAALAASAPLTARLVATPL